MPNRIIKESIHTSESVNAMTDFQFRLWVSLITYVDDFGRGDARPAVIKGSCFPLRDRLTAKDIAAALQALAGIGCVNLYEVDGKPYLCFPQWESHQVIRNKKSRYPAPPDNLQSIEINCNQLNANVSVIQSNPIRIQSNTNTNTNARFTPPTLEEVEEYCKERNSSVDPKQFFEYFEAGGWKDSKGNSVKNWKQKLLTWEKYDTPHNAKNTSYPAEPTRSAAEDDEAMKALLNKLKGA